MSGIRELFKDELLHFDKLLSNEGLSNESRQYILDAKKEIEKRLDDLSPKYTKEGDHNKELRDREQLRSLGLESNKTTPKDEAGQ